jgi:ribonuclease PH
MLSNCYFPAIVEDDEPHALPQPPPSAFEMPALSIGGAVVTGALGSASYSSSSSKILCSVFGPHLGERAKDSGELEKGCFECEVKFGPYIGGEDDTSGDERSELARKEKDLSNLTKQALESSLRLELYPKSMIKLYVLILQSSVDDLSAVITCGSLALADSSVELRDLVSSFTIPLQYSLSNSGTDESTDPVKSLDKYTDYSKATVSYMKQLDVISHMNLAGRLDAQSMILNINKCKEGCKRIRNEMDRVLLEKIASFS